MGKKEDVNLGRIIGKVVQGMFLIVTAILAPKVKKKWNDRKKS